MATLLLRFSAPMQSWGTKSDFMHRDTGLEPSKSGVVGLLCAALGRPRQEPIHDLSQLRMGVRVDQPGMIRRDYHTAGIDGFYKVSGKVERKGTKPSERFYLADAKFLVGLEGEPTMLEQLQAALQSPVWFLFFGRKAFVPAERIWLSDGLQGSDLEVALASYPWLGQFNDAPEQLRNVIEDPQGATIINDHPVSFAPRRFIPRRVHTIYSDLHISHREEES